MATGFETVSEGVTITIGPDSDDAFAITLHRGQAKVKAQEGNAMLADAKAIGTVIDGMYADLLAAEHDTE
jgi:hypothetical protein